MLISLLCPEDTSLHPSGAIRGREGDGVQNLLGHRHDKLVSPVSADGSVKSATSHSVALGSG